MSPRLAVLALLALAAPAVTDPAVLSPALAADGFATLLPGDSAHGILGAGETDRIRFTVVAGQRISADVRATFDPGLLLRGPGGGAVDPSKRLRESAGRARIRELLLPDSGDYVLEISSRVPGGTGGYSLATRGWAPRGLRAEGAGTPGAPMTLPLGDLPGGATAHLRARGGTLVSLGGPGGPVDAGGGRTASALLPGTGAWSVVVVPDGTGPVRVATSLRMPPAGRAVREVLDAPPVPPPPANVVGTVVLLRMRGGSDGGAFDGRHGCSSGDGVAGTGFTEVTIPPGEDVQTFLDEASRDGDVVEGEPVLATESPEGDPSSLPFNASDATTRTNVSQQQAFTFTSVLPAQAIADGTGVVVAVLDTGILPGTPDLAGHLVPGFDLVDGDDDPTDAPNGIDDDGDGQVDEGVGHGTFVAGLVAAIAPGAKILPVRVLDSDARGTSLNVAKGIVRAVDAGARVLNLSLGVKQPAAVIQDALNYARARNVLVVASAGNANLVDSLAFPASLSGVLSVAAVDATGVKAPFTNTASGVDLVAPGVQVLGPFKAAKYATWSGTSFAAPFASAGAALVLGKNPGMKPTDAGKVLVDTAVSVDPLNPTFQGRLGRGRIDFLRAVKAR